MQGSAAPPIPAVPPASAPPSGVTRPPPAPGGIQRRFARSRERPRGVAWFGFRSFWGHLRHFAASAIATEDVDSRDWMAPDDPHALVERVARLLGGSSSGSTLTERLGRELWIDYLADSGDDVGVSRAVARLIFTEYELPDPIRPGATLRAPRGDVLFFGGDTAYPVATADEIRDRVVVPFNQVLAERNDGRRRVLLGIPGNHDWYDGLDGFGRLFRRHVDYTAEGRARPTLHGSSQTMLGHYAEWARQFVRGGQVDKPKTLDFEGYTAVQAASYFALPVAPGLTILATDRQLKTIDSRQQFFFKGWLNTHLADTPWVVLPDPVYHFGHPSPTGVESIRSLGLTLGARPHLVLSGDIHHYRREHEGPTLHVTAGGGGAFLHPAPIERRGGRVPEIEWPSSGQSQSMLRSVPFKIALGRSGLLPHFAVGVLFAPVMFSSQPVFVGAFSVGLYLLITLVLALVGNLRKVGVVALLLAGVFALVMVGAALGARFGLALGVAALGLPNLAAAWIVPITAWLGILFFGSFLFGAYLSALTRLGYENTQAFTALDHPGFKHFVRFRVRADGSAIDGWVVGLVDPIGNPTPVLVDQFTWSCR